MTDQVVGLITYIDRAERILEAAHAVVDERLYLLSIKTIGGTVKAYRNELDNLVYDAFNHRIDAVDMRRSHKALINQLAPEVVIEGWHEGGLKDDDVDDEDRTWLDEAVNDWMGTQLESINGFAKDAYAAGDDKDARDVILGREELWVETLRDLGELGKAYALKSTRAVWRLGDRQTHTADCVRLSQLAAHRLAWWIDNGHTPPIHLGCGCRLENAKTGETIMGE